MQERISFEKLIIERIIIEVRFSQGFLYWDNCGKIWKKIYDRWPDLQMIKVDPQEAILKIRDAGLQLKFSQNDIHLLQEYPSSLKLFKEVANVVIPTITDFLEVKSLSRIGNRIFYLYSTKDIEEAENIVKRTGLLNLSDEKIKLFGDTLDNPKIGFKIQNEDVGYTFNLSSFSRSLNLELPKPLKIESSKFIKDGVLIDIDYFTRKTVDIAMVDFEDIVDMVQKNLKYNLTKLICGD